MPDESAVPETCSALTLAVGDNERTITVGNVVRSYVVRLPASCTGESAVPLVLDFHTIGGTPASEADASGYRELAEQAGFIVVYPQGLEGAWNIGVCCTSSRDVDDVGFSRTIVARVRRQSGSPQSGWLAPVAELYALPLTR